MLYPVDAVEKHVPNVKDFVVNFFQQTLLYRNELRCFSDLGNRGSLCLFYSVDERLFFCRGPRILFRHGFGQRLSNGIYDRATVFAECFPHVFIATSVIRMTVEALVWLYRDYMSLLEPNFTAILACTFDILGATAFVVHVFV